jgi:hypothetical protein
MPAKLDAKMNGRPENRQAERLWQLAGKIMIPAIPGGSGFSFQVIQ